MKKGGWKSDWLVGLLITLVFPIFSGSDFLQGLERSAYDFSVRSSSRVPSDKIAVIAIDDDVEQVVVRYRTAPDAAALQWLDKSLTEGKAHPFLFTQGQAILTRTWVPLQDTPAVRGMVKKIPHLVQIVEDES